MLRILLGDFLSNEVLNEAENVAVNLLAILACKKHLHMYVGYAVENEVVGNQIIHDQDMYQLIDNKHLIKFNEMKYPIYLFRIFEAIA